MAIECDSCCSKRISPRFDGLKRKIVKWVCDNCKKEFKPVGREKQFTKDNYTGA